MVVGVRFQVTQVMDAIELRLTTDVTGAQAVVDLGGIVTNVELDRGRPVNLVRVGMVVDALGRYLIDGGAMLYGVVERSLLSEQSLTSKERMVLGRWADDGLIEVTSSAAERAVEVADATGLPLIATRRYHDLAERFGWLTEGGGRVLLLTHRAGVASLRPLDDPTAEPAPEPVDPPQRVVGRAAVPARGDRAAADRDADADADREGEGDGDGDPDRPVRAGPLPLALPLALSLPLPLAVFAERGAARIARIRVSARRFRRAEPGGPSAALLRRQWRCDEFECPAFGPHRRIGQPVPRLRGEVPVCPRHDVPVFDAGPRPPGYALSVVVDDLPRRRLVVRGGEPVQVGRAEPEDSSIDPPEVVSVAPWLHDAAAAWVSPVHVRLEATEAGLVVTDVSENGVVVWHRKGPDDLATARPLRGDSCPLGEWDSVELYTGIELVPGDRRLAAVLGRDGIDSVLVDAPTAAHQQVGTVRS
jgi:hypothetical protein